MVKRLGSRRFNGELYSSWVVVGKKRDAEATKKQLKEKGYKVRLVKVVTLGKKCWGVYIRKA